MTYQAENEEREEEQRDIARETLEQLLIMNAYLSIITGETITVEDVDYDRD